MKKTYSTYEAKARLSEILKQVRERGETITVTYHGEPIAEIGPVSPEGGTSIADRVRELARNGVIMMSDTPPTNLSLLARKAGALDRFLAERDG
jgi:prevent-host-death family protein